MLNPNSIQDLNGSYTGVVENNKDPQKLGRIQVRIPSIHGVDPKGLNDSVSTEDLPWASPRSLDVVSVDLDNWNVPSLGTIVYVDFEDGQMNSPLYGGIATSWIKDLQSKLVQGVYSVVDLSGNIIRLISGTGKEMLEIFSRNKNTGNYSGMVSKASSTVSSMVIASDQTKGNKIVINADATNCKLSFVIVKGGEIVQRLDFIEDNASWKLKGSVDTKEGEPSVGGASGDWVFQPKDDELGG